MKQKIFLIIIFIVVSTCNLLAQGEAAHWHFGQKAGMDFTDMYTANNVTINGTVNQPLSGIPRFEAGPIITLEGCFSISDKNGNLLFSSDGRYVYNKNKQLMPNGSNLKGNASATQSGIVIPRPEHPDNYYIVTAPAFEGARTGLFYYEVDMKLDGGKGDVVVMEGTSDIKENPLNFGGIYPVTQAGENLAAIGHANGKEYWLVHRCRGYFFVWKVTKDGIAATPVEKYGTGYDSQVIVGEVGYTKFSADGKYIANICQMGNLIIGRFNSETGAVTDVKIRNVALGSSSQGYGVQFSPNGKYLYYSYFYSGPLCRLSVDKLLAGDNTETPLTVNSNAVNNIQMGPDSRIYGITRKIHAPLYYRNLYIILNPDEENLDLAIVPNYFPVDVDPVLSLPTFTSSFFGASEIELQPLTPCINKEATFSVNVNTGTGNNKVVRLDWNFGDGSPVVTETDMNKYIFSQSHQYKERGSYTVSITPYKDVAGTQPVNDKVQAVSIKISSCVLPVNHNISAMGYYD